MLGWTGSQRSMADGLCSSFVSRFSKSSGESREILDKLNEERRLFLAGVYPLPARPGWRWRSEPAGVL